MVFILSRTFSEKFAFVGPSIRNPETEIKKNKEKLIYISMGTVNNDMMPFYKRCISAFADTDFQIIMSVGNMVQIGELGDLPENVSVLPFVDQIAVLQQADVFVSHCGMNSVSESLYFGVPLVMLPQTTEQKGVAERVLQLGAGVKLSKTNEESLREAVNLLLNDNSYKESAKLIADGFKKCAGAVGAADKILSVCGCK